MLDAMRISDAYRRYTQMCKTLWHVVRDDTIHACKIDVSLCAQIDPAGSIWKLSVLAITRNYRSRAISKVHVTPKRKGLGSTSRKLHRAHRMFCGSSQLFARNITYMLMLSRHREPFPGPRRRTGALYNSATHAMNSHRIDSIYPDPWILQWR